MGTDSRAAVEASTSSGVFRGIPRGPWVKAGGPAEPSVAPRYTWHVFVKRAVDEISGNSSLALATLQGYFGQAIEFF